MTQLSRCLCCGLHQGAIFAGNYAIIVYGAALGITLWWIIEKEGDVPIPAYISLCLYTITFFSSILLVLSLSVQKKTSVLFAWLVAMAMFLLPECGLNMWISLFILGMTTGKGLAFLIFYLVRAIINVVCMICVHALYTVWKAEKESTKERISNMYWKSLYGNSIPPFLMWHTPIDTPLMLPPPPQPRFMGRPNNTGEHYLGAPQSPLMLTYPGYDSHQQPIKPPRGKRPKMVSSGEKIELQIREGAEDLSRGGKSGQQFEEAATTTLKNFRYNQAGDDSPDSAFSSEHSLGESSGTHLFRPVDRREMGFPPTGPLSPFPPPPFPLPHYPYPRPLPPNAFPAPPPPPPMGHHFLGPPPPPTAETSVYGAKAPMGWFPAPPPRRPRAMPPQETGGPRQQPLFGHPLQPPSGGPKIYEMLYKSPSSSQQNLHDPEGEPESGHDEPELPAGIENFMLRRSSGAQLQNYRPKSLTELRQREEPEESESDGSRIRNREGGAYHRKGQGTEQLDRRYRPRTKSSPAIREEGRRTGPERNGSNTSNYYYQSQEQIRPTQRRN